MGRFFPKTILKWREPAALNRARAEAESKAMGHWAPLLMTAFCMALCLISWGLAKLNEQLGGEPAFPLWRILPIGAVLLLLMYAVMWLDRRGSRASIAVTDQGITRNYGRGVSFWKYADIRSCALSIQDAGGEKVTVLVMMLDQPTPVVIGIPPSVPIGELRRVFGEHGHSLPDRDPTEVFLYQEREVPIFLSRRLGLNSLIIGLLFCSFVLVFYYLVPSLIAGCICIGLALNGVALNKDHITWLVLGMLFVWMLVTGLLEHRFHPIKSLFTSLRRRFPTTVEEAAEKDNGNQANDANNLWPKA
jgi:hypothetical protein